MKKPSTVARQETIEKLIELINSSELPAFVLLDIFEETLRELRKVAVDQYKRDKEKWDEYNRSKETNDETEIE